MEIKDCFDTDYIRVSGSIKRFCPYCGKEIKPEKTEDFEEYWKCDCEDALKAHDIRLKIMQLEYQLPTTKYHIAEAVVPWKENQ